MKVWPVSNENYALCTHGVGGPDAFTPTVIRSKEIIPYVLSPKAGIKARGNSYFIWVFRSQRAHSTITAAQEWLITLDEEVPEQDDVIVELEDGVTQYRLLDCVIEFAPAPPFGVLTSVQWTLTFSAYEPVVEEE